MNTGSIPSRTEGGFILKLLFVLLLLLTLAVVATGVLIARSLQADPSLPDLRTPVLEALDVPTRSAVDVHVPPLIFTAGRLVSLCVEMEEELGQGLRVMRSARIGAYELGEQPDRESVVRMMHRAGAVLEDRGWDRLVMVMDRNDAVLVYCAPPRKETDEVQASVIALSGRDLVIVSARGHLEPLVELAAARLPRTMEGLSWNPDRNKWR